MDEFRTFWVNAAAAWGHPSGRMELPSSTAKGSRITTETGTLVVVRRTDFGVREPVLLVVSADAKETW